MSFPDPMLSTTSLPPAGYVWPQPNAAGYLLNDGTGSLSWQLSTVAVVAKDIPGATVGQPYTDGNTQPALAGQWPWEVTAGQVPIVTHNGVAYAFTGGAGSWGSSSGGTALTAAMFTSLGSATIFAAQATVNTGTNTTEAINPATLRGTTLSAPSAAGATVPADADRIVRLNADGKIDAGFLTIGGLNILGGVDPTAAPVVPGGGFQQGDLYFVTTAGTADAGWTGVGGTALQIGDTLLYDGANWHALDANIDPSAFLPLAGGTMTNAAVVTFGVPAAGARVTRLDGSDPLKSAIDNFTLDFGVIP